MNEWSRSLSGFTEDSLMTQSQRAESATLPYHRTWLVTLNAGGKSARIPHQTLLFSLQKREHFFPETISYAGTCKESWNRSG
jgi:hypothetical protein